MQIFKGPTTLLKAKVYKAMALGSRVAADFCTLLPNICESSVRNLFMSQFCRL